MSVKSNISPNPVIGGSVQVPAYADTSGAPGSSTIQSCRGRAALPATSGSAITITNGLCKTTSTVFLSQKAVDTTTTAIYAVPGNGSFTVTPNVATTGIVIFDFFVCN